jgi:hypothetical protein
MSSSERHRQLKRIKTVCAACQERKAKFRYRGEVRADRDHTLCFECHRGEINRARARRLTEAVTAPRTWPPFGRPQSVSPSGLNARQVAHRQRMLDHLQRPSAVAS